jgi:hypothetical protein
VLVADAESSKHLQHVGRCEFEQLAFDRLLIDAGQHVAQRINRPGLARCE